MGNSVLEEFKELLKDHPHRVSEAAAYYEALLQGDTYLKALYIIPGVCEMLAALSKEYILCVVSGASRRLIEKRIMPKFNIPRVFSGILSSGDFNDPTKQKPHPHMITMLLAEHNILPSEAICVGDATADVQMSRAAGVTPVVVLTGHLTKEEARMLGVTYILPEVTHLGEILSQFASPR